MTFCRLGSSHEECAQRQPSGRGPSGSGMEKFNSECENTCALDFHPFLVVDVLVAVNVIFTGDDGQLRPSSGPIPCIIDAVIPWGIHAGSLCHSCAW